MSTGWRAPAPFLVCSSSCGICYLHLIGHCVELGAEAHDVLDVVLNEIGIAQLNEDPYHVLLREVAKKVLIKAVVSNQPQLVKLMLAGAQLDLPDSSRSAVSEREPNAVDAALSLRTTRACA